jgi:hypothetical protein
VRLFFVSDQTFLLGCTENGKHIDLSVTDTALFCLFVSESPRRTHRAEEIWKLLFCDDGAMTG